jgi:hypothetical protein
MTKKKEWWYVLVFTEDGPKYVTGTGEHHTAMWNEDEKPMDYSKDYAKQMAIGLTWNGHSAVAVCLAYELDSHPYNYKDYEIEWKKKEK